MSRTGSRRDRSNSGAPIEIINQYYVPDVASTGHLLHELATELAKDGRDVHVLTCFPSYGPPDTWLPCPQRETVAGVRVRRLRTTRFSKDNLLGRLVNSVTFLLPLALRQFVRRRPDAVLLYTSNPPYLGIIGALVSLIRRHPYCVLLHDAYPQLAIWVGKVRGGGLIERIWHRMNRLMYGRALGTIVLCDKARDLVCDTYGIDRDRVHVVPNWADPDVLTPVAKSETAFARTHDLLEDFTVMYSGNLGLYYDFDTVLDAADRLRDERVRFVLVGSGGQRGRLEREIKARDLANVIMLPYQPFETLNDSLNACDASLVSIAEGIEGISFPSKFYSSLAVAKPIVAISEEDSELRRAVESSDCGVWARSGDGVGLAQAILALARDPERCAASGRRARELMEREYTVTACAARYAEILDACAMESR